jgi:hypothetical protein
MKPTAVFYYIEKLVHLSNFSYTELILKIKAKLSTDIPGMVWIDLTPNHSSKPH